MLGIRFKSSEDPIVASSQPAAECPHSGRPIVRRRQYRVRSMGWTVVEAICPDCGASLRSESLKI